MNVDIAATAWVCVVSPSTANVRPFLDDLYEKTLSEPLLGSIVNRLIDLP